MKTILTILGGMLKVTTSIDLNKDGKDEKLMFGLPTGVNLIDFFKNLDGKILIFDDLERCNIELSSIMGYINKFVEHQKLKVILVANEEELTKRNDFSDNAYKIIKEKLIGKTFNVLPDFSSALKEFIEKSNDSDLKHFLKSTELIKDLYKQANYNNLRTLKQIVLDFERIFDQLPDKSQKNSEVLEELLRYLTAYSIEIRCNAIFPIDIEALERDV